ncbi:MAG: acetate--CoA ligase family protein, partial [Methyloligellaceae bacterium]
VPDAGCLDAAADLTPPFALKVISPDILHKSDVGGVALGLQDLVAVRQAIADMSAKPGIRDAQVEGFLVEEMAQPGHEIVIGALNDPHFGPVIMAGLGGVFVEILQDVAFRICPITEREARSMLQALRGWPVLEGARGRPGADIDAIVNILLNLGGADGLLMAHGDALAEVDLNPVIVDSDGAVAVDARFVLAAGETSDSKPDSVRPFADLSPQERFAPLFAPRTVAVVGASARATTIANTFIRRMKDFDYPGTIYPIHPEAATIEGCAAFPSLAETPEPIDYAYVAVGAAQIPDLIGAAGGRVRFAHVISSGFGEVEQGRALEAELVRKAHEGGCRVIGPNCLGLYSPRGGVTFPVGAPKEVGPVGVISQSGGLSTDIIKRCQWRGVRFSGLVTIGNGADIGSADLLDFYLDDPLTEVIGLYLEDTRDGRRLFEILRSGKTSKPVVILKGGRSRLGEAAAASHTGALAGHRRIWEALTAQTPSVLVETIDEFIDVLLALQYLTLRAAKPTQRVALFGNGGGSGVLAVDYFAKCGLEIAPFDEPVRSRLEAMGLPPGTSVSNPIDTPVRTLQEKDGAVANEILDIIYEAAAPDAVVMHLNLASFVGRADVDPIDNLIAAALRVQKAYPGRAHFLMALRVDGSPELEAAKRAYRQAALEVGIPVYDELANTADALAAVSHLERQFRSPCVP